MKTAELVSASPKLPPQALEAEQSLLGGLLLDNRRWDEVNDEVGVSDFYSQNHRLIFEAIRGLQGSNQPADVITVSEWLEQNGALEESGGLAYIGNLAGNTPSTANILTYARIVRGRAILRSLISAASEISESAFTPEGRTPARCSTTRKSWFSTSRSATGRAQPAGVHHHPGAADALHRSYRGTVRLP